jgi:hypothetical protein
MQDYKEVIACNIYVNNYKYKDIRNKKLYFRSTIVILSKG